MSKKRKKDNDDIEVLAIWVTQTALADGKFNDLRKLMQDCANDAMEHYSSGREDDVDDPYDPDGVRGLITRFIAQMDESKVTHDEDNK